MNNFTKKIDFIVFDCNHMSNSHIQFNTAFIKNLSLFGRVRLFTWDDSYDFKENYNIEIIKKRYLIIRLNNSFLARLVNFINTLLNAFYSFEYRHNKKSTFVLLGYELITFSICSFFFPRKLHLIHHMQLDELSNKFKRAFFSLLKNRFNHIVMTDYIKLNLVSKFKMSSKFIKVIPHPIYEVDSNFTLEKINYRLFISLNYSVDELYIYKLIELETNTNCFEKNGCRLIIKSKLYNFSSPGLFVFNGYLPNEEYYSLYRNSICVISMLTESFEYRISGTLIDAISAGKSVISLKSFCADYYLSYFRNGIAIYNDFTDLVDAILNFKTIDGVSPYNSDLLNNYKTDYINSIKNTFTIF